MKTRTDFVSNSSSSSFILSKPELFEHYGIAKQDIEDALVELYGGEEKFSSCKPFHVYELPADTSKAIADYGWLLSQWDQCVPVDHTMQFLSAPGKATELFHQLLNAVSEAYGSSLYRGTEDELNDKWYGRKLPSNIKEAVLDVRKRLGVKTAAEVLRDDNAWLFVHFDDNEAWSLARTQELCKADIRDYTPQECIDEAEKSSLTTESYTFERLLEVLLLKLAEQGKLKLDDIDVLAKCYPIAEYCDKDGTTRTWLDGKKYKPADLVEESCLHCCMHEG